MKKKDNLTPKQERFCREYVIDLNGKEAATRAGYSAKTAGTAACKMLDKPAIKKKVAELQENIARRVEIRGADVVREFAKVAFANMADYVDEDNQIVDLSKLSRSKMAAVDCIQADIRYDSEKSKGYTKKIKIRLYNKLTALENIGKHLGIYENDNKQQVAQFVLSIGKK